jgi:hypothetical protein
MSSVHFHAALLQSGDGGGEAVVASRGCLVHDDAAQWHAASWANVSSSIRADPSSCSSAAERRTHPKWRATSAVRISAAESRVTNAARAIE